MANDSEPLLRRRPPESPQPAVSGAVPPEVASPLIRHPSKLPKKPEGAPAGTAVLGGVATERMSPSPAVLGGVATERISPAQRLPPVRWRRHPPCSRGSRRPAGTARLSRRSPFIDLPRSPPITTEAAGKAYSGGGPCFRLLAAAGRAPPSRHRDSLI